MRLSKSEILPLMPKENDLRNSTTKKQAASFIRLMSISIPYLGVFVAMGLLATSVVAQTIPTPTAEDLQLIESSKRLTQSPSFFSHSILEWMGPLAPIALSPFFGLACLSGIASYGPEWLQQRSSVFGGSSLLNNPALFWVMVTLTVMTSLPRFSKVSKPIALAAEKLETYSVIIIVVSMRIFSSIADTPTESVSLAIGDIHTAGIASLPVDVLIGIASAINIVVINGVKLFMEFIVWLTPIPALDAIVEIANKTVCVGLMGLYCWSPFVATMLNLAILFVCGLVFLWTQRRLVYYYNMIVSPILGRFFGSLYSISDVEDEDGQTAFLADSWNGLPRLSRVHLKRSSVTGWTIARRTWWSRTDYPLGELRSVATPGIFGQTVRLGDEVSLIIHRPDWKHSSSDTVPAC